MKTFLKNKTVLITGASSGIGEQLAIDLAPYELSLILLARSHDKLASLQKKIVDNTKSSVSIYTLDVRDRDATASCMNNILQQYDVDILINNAGLALGLEPVDQGNIDDWDTMIDTNIKGLLYVSKPMIAHMRNKNSGHIVNIGSLAGRTAYPNGNVYCASKAAVHSIGEGMNADLLETNIKVTTIAPGAAETNFSNTRFHGDDDRADAVYHGFTPLTASDIASTIIHVINTPEHVNIQYVDIMPTAQRNPYLLNKK